MFPAVTKQIIVLSFVLDYACGSGHSRLAEGYGGAGQLGILQERGAIPVCTGNAQGAFESLQNQTFDILLSDIGLPELDGYGLIRRVRAMDAPACRIPAIAVTAYARTEDRHRCKV